MRNAKLGTLSKEAQKRVQQTLEYAESEVAETYKSQKISNARDDFAKILEDGIAYSKKTNRGEQVCDALKN